MRKLLKSRKALSPVVAAIILIAVTVAVSIAVAAWMGALTFTFMRTEELKILGHTWDAAAPPANIVITVKNSGTAKLEIKEIRVNDGTATFTADPSEVLNPGDEADITITPTAAFVSGTKYAFEFITVAGNRFGPYTAVAPS